MIAYSRAGWNIDELLPRITRAVVQSLAAFRGLIARSPLFERHRTLLSDALSAYERGEYALAAAAVIPRIEGLLREHRARRRISGTAQTDLIQSATDLAPHSYSLPLPMRFREYLKSVFFAWEDFRDPTAVKAVTRHSITHGVSPDALLGVKEAALAILVLQQLAILLRPVEAYAMKSE